MWARNSPLGGQDASSRLIRPVLDLPPLPARDLRSHDGVGATANGSPGWVRAAHARLRPGLAGAGLLIGVAGCGASPSVNILGSFFPAWLISIVIGVVLTVVVRQVLIAVDVANDLKPAALVYPCLVGLLTLATWLVVFGS